jgi:peptide/nickel transport system permease protein
MQLLIPESELDDSTTEVTVKSASMVSEQQYPPAPKHSRKVLRFTFPAVSREVVFSLCVLSLLFSFALSPKLFTTRDPLAQELGARLTGPSTQYLLGTDKLGRDVFSRIVYGARVSLFIASASVLISGIIGVTMGMLAGYYGGSVETVLMRLTDIQLALPPVLLAIVIVSIAGPSVENLILVLVTTGWVGYSRVVFNTVRSLREREFVIAARTIGATDARVLIRHILVNQWGPVIVISCVQGSYSIISEAMLSFLGLGVQPPNPSWGNMLREGYDLISVAPWLNIYPGLTLTLAIYSINAIGEALRQRFAQ